MTYPLPSGLLKKGICAKWPAEYMPPPPQDGFQPGTVLQTSLQGTGECQDEEVLTTLSTCLVRDVDLVARVTVNMVASANATNTGKPNPAVRKTALSL